MPAVAIFWADGEDHDWDEVRSCTVLDADAGPRAVALPASPDSARPVGRVTLDGSVEAALAELKAALPSTEFTPRLLEDLARIYRPGVGMSAAFAAWIEALLGPLGLVVTVVRHRHQPSPSSSRGKSPWPAPGAARHQAGLRWKQPIIAQVTPTSSLALPPHRRT